MCQTSRRKRFKKTKKDLTVYKVMIVTDNIYYNGIYSKFQYFKYELNIEYNETLEEIKKYINSNSFFKYYINVGFHSYVNLEDAKSYCSGYENRIVECTIPKGSYVNYGRFCDRKSVVSNKIIIKKVLN